MLNFDLDIIKGYRKCILTPNVVEFKRLYETIVSAKCISLSLTLNLFQIVHFIKFKNKSYEIEKANPSDDCEYVRVLADSLGNVTVLKKGAVDIISDGKQGIFATKTISSISLYFTVELFLLFQF
jgi:ATP-dependent NAD(P)H-hydrate dehydratase